MRCLWITRQDPRAADSGELIYTLGLLSTLSAQPGMELTVLAHEAGKDTVTRDLAVTWELHGSIPGGRLGSLASKLPSDAFRLGNPTQRAALDRLLRKSAWDLVIIDQAACAWALDHLSADHRVVYVAHNHEAEVRRQVAASGTGSLPLRAALRWDAAKYGRMERRLLDRAALVTAITPRDAQAFSKEVPGASYVVLPPGYDGPVPEGAPIPITEETPRRVVLAGAFEWLAKRRNLETFLRAAAAPFQQAGIGFQVVGKADAGWFSALKREHPWADFTSNVPSVAPYLERARIGLIPEALGGGFKLKALDYIFRGLPLAAVEPALSGVPVVPGVSAIAAADPASLATAVTEKIDDLDFLNRAATVALDACRGAFRWADRGKALADALKEARTCPPCQ